MHVGRFINRPASPLALEDNVLRMGKMNDLISIDCSTVGISVEPKKLIEGSTQSHEREDRRQLK